MDFDELSDRQPSKRIHYPDIRMGSLESTVEPLVTTEITSAIEVVNKRIDSEIESLTNNFSDQLGESTKNLEMMIGQGLNEEKMRTANVRRWHESYGQTLTNHDEQITRLLIRLARNPIVRFLNHFGRWYTFSIVKNLNGTVSLHDKYIIYLTLYEEPRMPSEYEGYYRYVGDRFKEMWASYRRHLKEVKQEGFTLKNMEIRF